jgi:hypothetical protein
MTPAINAAILKGRDVGCYIVSAHLARRVESVGGAEDQPHGSNHLREFSSERRRLGVAQGLVACLLGVQDATRLLCGAKCDEY